ncbi:hypothetical protein [Mycolicibacterium sp. CBMA 226]|uniref:DUF7373 family lipoprotein n=1 Tax=Mycolicibacterium sp. CBMA 226 TaxID=2606611 RepID=UPI0012DE12EB|nr:hypothetical protein [Mycolicibacterium sp. CBMA 226]MUL78847.1 hypothetical protein [Mycolicibacterium sp. CBMA 226]QGW61144.1 hypothetical protein ICEMyc226_00112 [Mycolicibacterium sp.]
MDYRGTGSVLGALTAALTAVVVAGCSSTMDGSATKPPSTSAPAGAADASQLDHGNYAVEPRQPLGEAGKPELGALLEAQRLANYVTGPWEVDPALTAPLAFGIGPGSLALPGGAKALATFFSPDQNQAMALDGYVNGFATARAVKNQKQLMNIVLRFTDPAAASAAANSIAQAQIAHPIPLPPPIPTTSITIPGHPDAVATTHMFEDKNIGQTWTVVDSFTPHGPFVLMQRAQLIGPADGATAMVAKTLDLQGPAIDKAPLVDPAQFATVQRDPSGLLARAIPVPKGGATPNSNMTLDAHGLLNFDGDPVAGAKNLSDAGVDVGVNAAGWVYRAKDAASATGLVNALVAKMQADGPVNETVPNLPGSHCQKAADGKSATCVASADRYAYQIDANTLKDAQQQAAAQYLLLTAK